MQNQQQAEIEEKVFDYSVRYISKQTWFDCIEADCVCKSGHERMDRLFEHCASAHGDRCTWIVPLTGEVAKFNEKMPNRKDEDEKKSGMIHY
jgi:hypothetical protein